MTFRDKITGIARIDKSIRLVFTTSPGLTIINTVLFCIQGVVPLALLYTTKLIVDALSEGVQKSDPLSSFYHVALLILLTGIVILIGEALKYCTSYFSEAQGEKVQDHIQKLIHQKSTEVDLSYYENPEYYNTLHRAQWEGAVRPNKIVSGLISTGNNGVGLSVMIGLLFTFHWSIALLLFLATLPGALVRLVYSKKQYDWYHKRTDEHRKASYFNWILSTEPCAKEIRLFNTGSFFKSTYQDLRKIIRGEKLELSRKRLISEFFSRTIAVLILSGCFLAIAHSSLTGKISLGEMVMYFLGFQRGLAYLQNFLENAASLYEDNLFASFLFQFLNVEHGIEQSTDHTPLTKKDCAVIKISNLSFQYPTKETAVLNDVTMDIGDGEVVALVGSNGSGKSTLVKLLCRLYDPDKGSITMNGQDYKTLSPYELRKQISTVFQDFMRYNLTVKENIWLGDIEKDVDSKNVFQAAGKAQADGFIQGLNNSFDSMLGSFFFEGKQVSLGEWQKIGLARAFFRDAQFIILDEPASSLDPHTEYIMFNQFKELIGNRSALLISHRLSAVRMADKICVLADGIIKETGTHEELIQQQGLYADMYKKQSALYKF